MRKVLLSLALIFAVCTTSSVMAQDANKAACPQKTECTKPCDKEKKCCKSEEKKCTTAEKKCCKKDKQATAGKN